MFSTLVEAVLSHSESNGDKPAIILKKRVLSYFQLGKQIRETAKILREQYGISAGDRVMVSALSKPEFLVVFLGIQYLHAITVPLDRVWLEETVFQLYEFVRPKIVITDMLIQRAGVPVISLRELYGDILAGKDSGSEYILPDMNCTAEMLFTTGTTGMPKGVLLTYGNIRAITNNNIEGVGIRPDDVVLNALPLCHSLGIREARMTLYTGATLVLQNGFSFPRELRENIQEFNCTGFVCVPATMEKLTRSVEGFAELFSHFRYIEIGAGSLSYDLKKRLPKMLPDTNIYNTWGSSETGGVIFLDVKHRQDKTASLGKPVTSARIKVIGDNGDEIHATSIDNAGRMAVYGEMIMSGYYNMPEINRITLVDGWLVTNDLVYTDDDGFVYMLGRADDMINVGGEKVSPIEVENVATEYDKVRDAACIGVTDEIMGQVPVLFVQSDDPFSEAELAHFIASRLETYKVPKVICRVSEIPRNRMKKLERKAVMELWENRNNKTEPGGGFIQTLLSRHSVRDFTDKKIDKGILETLIAAGIQAPTGHNLQTWRFTVVMNADVISRIKAVGKEVAAREKTGFYGFNNPDALILVSNDRRNDCGAQDASCAAENILLAAHALGLGGCWLNGLTRICDQPEIRRILDEMGIPQSHLIWAMIALGYPASEDKKPVRKTDVVAWIE